MRHSSAYVFLAAAMLLPAGVRAGDGELSREKVAQLGKAATARAELSPSIPKIYFSAFCIDRSGIFISTASIGETSIPGNLNLVLDPGLKTERTLHGKVLRTDESKKLAVIQVEGAKGLTALELGSDDDLTEAMDVLALGYPRDYGTGGRHAPLPSPSFSANVRSISSLPREDGRIQSVRIDGPLDTGHLGGPLLDRHGRVVGVVVSPSAMRYGMVAAPVSFIAAMLAKPDVDFRLPVVAQDALYKPAAFELASHWLLPPAKAVAVELVLKNGNQAERRFPMELVNGVYRAAVAPLPKSNEPEMVKVAIQFAGAALAGSAEDQTIKVGEKDFTLGKLRCLTWRPHAEVVLADGKTVAGPITGLDSLAVKLGKHTVRVKLDGAKSMDIETVKPLVNVECTAIVKLGEVEVARTAAPLTVIAPPAAADETVRPGAIRPIEAPPMERDQAVRPLPGAIDDIVTGGGGRYLVARLAGQQQLVVFDVQLGRIVKQISLPEADALFTAGEERLIIIYPGAKLIHVWSLKTLERQRSIALPDSLASRELREVCMGSATHGPLFAYIPPEKRTLALDLDSMTTTQVKWTAWSPNDAYGPLDMRVSADGSILAGWGGGWVGSEVAFFDRGKQISHSQLPEFGGPVLPSVDGRLIYTPTSIIGRALTTTRAPALHEACFLPAAEPGYFLAVEHVSAGWRAASGAVGSTTVSVYNDDRQLLFRFRDLDELKSDSKLSWEKRIYYYPRAALLVTLGGEQDRLVLRRIDVANEMEKSGIDYLVVLSQPPPVKPGELFSYKLDVRSKKGGVKVSLESGPDGLTATPDGRINWQVPARVEFPEYPAVVTVRDASGQEVFHRFTLRIAK